MLPVFAGSPVCTTNHRLIKRRPCVMRIIITVPDELWKAVTNETDDVSAFIVEALEEKLKDERQLRARQQILALAGTEKVSKDVLDILQQERRESGRV